MEKVEFIWNDIPICITYRANTSEYFKNQYGYAMAHLAIESKDRQPLPITETGFRSRFLPEPHIQELGTPKEYVQAWLNEEANSTEWKTHLERERQNKQLQLF